MSSRLTASRVRAPFALAFALRIAPILSLVLVVLLFAAHARVYAQFLSDDALIAFRYARRLAHGEGLTWTRGERVEGYTDFLWVILVSCTGFVRNRYIDAALTLDRIGAVLAIVMVSISPKRGPLSSSRVLVGGGLLAASIPIAVWANGGLEHGFMTGILAVGLFFAARNADGIPGARWKTGVAFASLTLLRADGLLLALLTLAGAAADDRLRRGRDVAAGSPPPLGTARRWAPLAAFVLSCFLAQLAFRRIYYGAWQPNTALAKLALTRDRLAGGLDYLERGMRAMAVLAGIGSLSAVVLIVRRCSIPLACLTLVVGWSGYLWLIGGDIFPGWRQLVFVFVPFAFLAAECAEWVADKYRKEPIGLCLVWCGISAAHYSLQSSDSENTRAKNERWSWDGYAIGSLLKSAFGSRQPLYAVDAAGALPYWSEFPCLDMLGLNDAYIAHHPPSTFGHGEIGHELGDGKYVLRRAPDIISFNSASGDHSPNFLSGRQLLAMPEFLSQYQWIRIQSETGDRAVAEVWVRRSGGRLGIVQTADRIEVPGYFLTGPESAAIARIDATKTLAVTMSEDDYGVLPGVNIPAGTWKVRLEPAASVDTSLGFKCNGRSMEPIRDSGDVVVDLPSRNTVQVVLGPRLGSHALVHVRSLVFERSVDLPTLECARPGMPVAVPLAQLAPAKPERLWWAHPSNFVFGAEGLRARVEAPERVRAIDISLDSDDSYALTLERTGSILWQGDVSSVSNGGGLALRHVSLCPAIAVQAGDTLFISPASGDGRYSVGSVRLLK